MKMLKQHGWTCLTVNYYGAGACDEKQYPPNYADLDLKCELDFASANPYDLCDD